MRPFYRGWSWRGAAVFGALLLAPPRTAPAADGIYAVDTVRVDSPRTHLPSPQFTSVLPGRLPAEAFADLSQRLAHAVGVSVRSYGAPGALSAVSIRGSSPAQIDVYYDGVPLARARDG